jgi:hypothetical protein
MRSVDQVEGSKNFAALGSSVFELWAAIQYVSYLAATTTTTSAAWGYFFLNDSLIGVQTTNKNHSVCEVFRKKI